MSPPPRRSLLSKFFGREPDPHRPLDLDYRQSKWVRLYRPGPWRVAVMVPMVVVVALVTAVILLTALSVPGHLVVRITGLFLAALIVTAMGLMTTRLLTAGVYVNDESMRLLSLGRTRIVPWSQVVDVRRVPAVSPLLGIPVLPRHAERVQLVLRGGADLLTPVTTVSADFAGRAEAYDIAALALERWWLAGRA